MKKTDRRVQWALAFLAMLATSAWGADPPARYGAPVRFARDHETAFAHFTVRFLGERKVASPIFKRGFLFYDFEVRSPKSTQTVSWSSGTGVIDSASFKVDGRPYELELRGSVAQKKWLRADEMVVWPQAEFLKALAARNKGN